MADNLYIHFPFCRRKCAYCALHSRAGQSAAAREAYVADLAGQIAALRPRPPFSTIYFGGGSPALCELSPLAPVLRPLLFPDNPSFSNPTAPNTEFTVELHPLDVTREKLEELKALGVNRVSMGLQSLDDDILARMGRGYTFAEAERAFYLIKEHFDNAGIDLIVGYPGEAAALLPRHARLAKWGIVHCSVYSLILEEKSILARQVASGATTVPDDDTVLNRISVVSRFLADLGLRRYEISNYAKPGFECRHNLATWRGEDYLGLGEGAAGRVGLMRTMNGEVVETLSPERDRRERRLFQLRTRDGISAEGFPEWLAVLEDHVKNGLLARAGDRYRLTERGTEVCDSILADLV